MEFSEKEKTFFEKNEIQEEFFLNVLEKFVKDDKVITMPKKYKKKICIYVYGARFFEFDKVYLEKDVNEIIKEFYEEDYVTFRRALIDYNFLLREKDGSKYHKSK